jgi:nitrogen regulatory protein P-II 1/nitrogen regulatory protein P-II 2
MDLTVSKVIAIIRAGKVNDVRDALAAEGVGGITITEVMGYGRQRGHQEQYRGAEYTVSMNPKVKIEVVVIRAKLPEILAVIHKSGQTGSIGDGKVFVEPIDEVVRIRTGERGVDAV